MVLGQPAAHRLVRQTIVIGQLDHGVGKQFQRPAASARRRVRARRRHQQGFLLAGQLALGPRTRQFAHCVFQIALHKTALGAIDSRAAHRRHPGNLLVAASGIRGKQDLGSLELTGSMPASLQHGVQLVAFGLAQFHSITYVHCGLLVGGTGRIQR